MKYITQPDDPAVPISLTFPSGEREIWYGLTKREAFVMAAMQAVLSNTPSHLRNVMSLADEAIRHADETIAALNAEKKDLTSDKKAG